VSHLREPTFPQNHQRNAKDFAGTSKDFVQPSDRQFCRNAKAEAKHTIRPSSSCSSSSSKRSPRPPAPIIANALYQAIWNWWQLTADILK
jgi:hypothetical protein